MQAILDQLISGSLLSFLLVLARIGTFLMIMPGVGDAYVSPRVRLSFAMGLALVITPMVMQYLPAKIPPTHALAMLVMAEVLIGFLIGSVVRVFFLALDTGGMIISMQSGLANAQVLNPSLASQGSLIGAFLIVTGIVVIFSTQLHHILLMGAVESYQFFPVGVVPDTGSMAELISKAISKAFFLGVKMGMPFIVLTLLVYAGMGVISRLMPQIQVFMVLMPLQILLSFILLALVMTALIYYWIEEYEAALFFFFSNGVITK